ncbi:transcriptional regulator (anti-sigma factor) [Agaricicola taiwanensis]|uniref:Transcriptional regulator (Anti-sigma factor) n=1 Tax=Agaricicola taiwanensis TaxID=591372 RepID=A0A8J2VMB6_9RHOB|nr:anti-sigma factor [Agaricicola taiwanensis]GGE32986.1 transcriptional regulator (anti-sigma factor) [Agaricicola taiwanensis]
MTKALDPITPADFDSYVDDQLDVTRRIEVEAYLSARPDDAAKVMADLRLRDELRLATAGPHGLPRTRIQVAARRLERGLYRDRLFSRLQRAAAITVFIAAGWLAHEMAGPLSVTEVVASTPPPAYVEDAARAHGTMVLRASMQSQPEVTNYDPEEIRAATAIVMPELPKSWHVRDVQIYPSRFGPSVELAVDSKDFGLMSLFAVRPGTFDVVRPTQATSEETSSAYFQIGEVAYALVAAGKTKDLSRAAERLADTLY